MRVPLATTLMFTCLIAGCAAGPTPEQRRAADQQTCMGYGFQPGSESFANCMMQTAQRRQDAQHNKQQQNDYIRAMSLRRSGDKRYPVCSATTPGARLDVQTHSWYAPGCRAR
jgi:hypothetical protein